VRPPDTFAGLDEAIGALADFHWVIFTSVNGVDAFFERLHHQGLDSRALGQCRVAVVGPKTGESLSQFGIRPDLVPSGYHAEGIVEAFGKLDIGGKRALYLRGDRARDVIAPGLTQLGMEVAAPVAYRTVTPDSLPREAVEALEEKRVHCVSFTSSSAVGNLASLVGENRLLYLLDGVAVASIGPVTSGACRELGLRVDMEPVESTIEALTEEIVRYFHKG
jgi:uroporphyrinogen III methyltransferase/synthase